MEPVYRGVVSQKELAIKGDGVDVLEVVRNGVIHRDIRPRGAPS
jgi:hypothetical protein